MKTYILEHGRLSQGNGNMVFTHMAYHRFSQNSCTRIVRTERTNTIGYDGVRREYMKQGDCTFIRTNRDKKWHKIEGVYDSLVSALLKGKDARACLETLDWKLDGKVIAIFDFSP